MPFDSCPECKVNWFTQHRPWCPDASKKFLGSLAADGWNTADDFPRCPKCGCGTEEWHEFAPRYAGDGDTMTVTCAMCEHEYPTELVVRYSFRVKPAKAAP